MDARRFDAIAKALISETNRRRTLAGLLGGALGALGLVGPDDIAMAKSGKCDPTCDECNDCKKGKCKKKNGKKSCKPGKCKPKDPGTPCTAPSGGATCQNGVCTCSSGLTNCVGICKDLKSDKVNCATCNTVCPENQVCVNGTCVCPAGLELCNGACVPVCDPDLQARNPDTCTCCIVSGIPICQHPGMGLPPQPSAICCSGFCSSHVPPQGVCAQGEAGTPCNVNANCTSDNCTTGLCCEGLCPA